MQGVLLAEGHLRQSEGYLAGNELSSTQRRFVIEENAGAGEQAVGLAVIHRDPVREQLAHAIRAARMKGRGLALRRRLSLAEHFRRRRLVKARPWASLPYAFEQ